LRKFLLPLLAIVILLSLVIYPNKGFTSAQDDIAKELAKVKKKEETLQKRREDAKKQSSISTAAKNAEVQDRMKLLQEIDDIEAKIAELDKQKEDVMITLRLTGDQLQEATDRVSARDEILKSRLRLMYMNGSISYMDVLFNATSFSDFLDRFLALQNIVGQDKKILEANKADRDLKVTKKQQTEDQLAQIQSLSDQSEDLKDKRTIKLQQKDVLIASLDKDAKVNDEISEDAEKAIVALAQQRADLLAQQRAELIKRKKELANNFVYSGGKLAWPVPDHTVMGDGFGMRIDPIKHISKLHKGIDIPAPNGTTIVAAESGTVLIASQVNGYGNTVVIDHGGGLWTWYGHIRDGGIKVSEGQSVKRGQKIAEVGSTGDSTGNHLHFEVRVKQEAVNPLPYLK
jgi:murein DD-endopeptidase MepM/ murein hydrolase activator NlpD